MATYKASYYNVNGPMTTCALSAKTARGAKTEAYRCATGEQTRIVLLENSQPIAERIAPDSFHGFCQGPGKWQDIP